MVEFYGKLSDAVARAAERLRRHYYARYIAVLAALCAAVALVAGLQSGLRGWLIPLIAALLLAGVAAALYFLPAKAPARGAVRITVDADAGTLTVVQQAGGKEVKKQRPLRKVRRVYKSPLCYVVAFTDLGSAVVCERSLLRKGTPAFFEHVFAQKLCEKDVLSLGAGER